MALTLTQGGMTFPDASQLLGAGSIVAVRWSYNHTRNIGDPGSSGGHVGPHVTMPPTKDSGSRYLVLGQSHWNDTNQNTAGGGLAIWTNVQGISSYWCYKAGHHAKYDSIGSDRYRFCTTTELDLPNDPTTGGGNYGSSYNVSAGKVRKYRLYAHGHNSNMIGCCGVGGQDKSRAQIIVAELSAGFIVPGYGN